MFLGNGHQYGTQRNDLNSKKKKREHQQNCFRHILDELDSEFTNQLMNRKYMLKVDQIVSTSTLKD